MLVKTIKQVEGSWGHPGSKLGQVEPSGRQNGAKWASKCKARRHPKQLDAKTQKVPKVSYVSHFWGVGASKLELCWGYVGAMLGLCWGYVGHVGAMLGYVGHLHAIVMHLGASWSPILGLSWPMLGYLGAG